MLIRWKTLALAMMIVAGTAGAHSGKADPLELTDKTFMQLDAAVMAAKGKPSELERLLGLKSHKRGSYAAAADHFRKAAQYADKYSQHYLSLMYWHGAGVPVDRAQAYIWADLAAERGSRKLLLIREKMWSQMTGEEQRRAQAEGLDYYARYGDESAKPRAERLMRSFARDMTGSRVGYRNQMMEIAGAPVNGSFIPDIGANAGAYMVADAVAPEQLYGTTGGLAFDGYWNEQDELLDGVGTVEVGKPTRDK